MERFFGATLILILAFLTSNFWQSPAVLGDSTPSPAETLPVNQSIKTQSAFTQRLEEEKEMLPKKVIYQDDPQTEAGEEKVLEEGSDGLRTKIIKITLHYGKEFEREIISIETKEPADKKMLRGTKVVWRALQTPDGEIKYWKKMRVYATHYDSRCPGCNEWTAIGMRAGKGVIAVDPKVIPLRSKVYIPGYGQAIAGDTGGAIKGNIIDLGFDDAKTAGWSARFIDIYLL